MRSYDSAYILLAGRHGLQTSQEPSAIIIVVRGGWWWAGGARVGPTATGSLSRKSDEYGRCFCAASSGACHDGPLVTLTAGTSLGSRVCGKYQSGQVTTFSSDIITSILNFKVTHNAALWAFWTCWYSRKLRSSYKTLSPGASRPTASPTAASAAGTTARTPNPGPRPWGSQSGC